MDVLNQYIQSMSYIYQLNYRTAMKLNERQYKMNENEIQTNLFSLQKNLLQVWHNLNVDEYYQNLILSHLDSLPPNQAQSFISKEIRATHEGSSRYFKLQERLRARQKQLSALSNLVKKEGFKKATSTDTLLEISQMLSQLRDHNLVVAQMLISLHRQYKNGEQNNVSDECIKIFNNLDSDNNFLKDSFLNQFILFQQGYDPFFLYHYDMKGKKQPTNTHPIITNIFNLTISYACRLFKAKTKILQILSSGQYNQTKIFKRKSHSLDPSSKRIIQRFPKPQSYRTIQRDDNFDFRRQTNSNFKTRKLSLQKAKERERFKQSGSESQDSYVRYKPIINKQKFTTLPQESQDSDNNQQYYKLVPIKYNKKKNMPRSQFLQDLKKHSVPLNQTQTHPIKYSLNFKEKLSPISNRQFEGDYQQSKNRNSIFKRETIRQPLFVKKQYYKKEQDQPLEKKAKEEKNIKQPQTKQPIIQSQTKPAKPNNNSPQTKQTNISQNVQIKMRPGKLNLKQLMPYLKQLNISQQLKNETILNNKYEESFSKYQTYVSEFVVNGQVKAVGICHALQDGEYIIKFWGSLQNCSEQTNKLLLGKYIEYLQKQTTCNNIYYSGNSKSLFAGFNFTPKNEKLYCRRRVNAKVAKQLQFPQFLSIKCSNLLFSQQNKDINMLYSQQIEPFNQKNYYADLSFIQINKDKLNKTLALSSKISEEVADMKALNSLLEDEDLDTYQVTSAMKISNISAIRLSLCINLKPGFIAGDGFFKFTGQQIYRKNNSVICKIQGAQYSSSILFAKGFPNINNFITSSKQSKKKPCEFSIKMFNKQLYGRMINKNIERCSYGNWQFSFSWKDQLQGRVKHNMNDFEMFGLEPFYLGIQIQSQLIFCFQVNSQDFLF